MTIVYRLLGLFASLGALGAAFGLFAFVGLYFYYAPTQPDVEGLKNVQLQVPLRVYTRDGRLIAQFGDKRRLPVTWDELPETLVQAYVSAEDDRFFEHPGVDYQGLIRSVYRLVKTGRKRGGGSTITMQLARAVFLTPDQRFSRKFREIYLALKMEREFSKQEIITLYLNTIFFGQRAYGVGAAAQVYYGKQLHELTLGETATLAGLPQAPSSDNPIRSPERAQGRRHYVLRRMLETGAITQAEHDLALEEPIETFVHGTSIEVSAPYVAEMVRREVEERFGRDAINQGIEVITSLDSALQTSAQNALRRGLFEYDRRHGFRGAIGKLKLADYPTDDDLRDKLASYPTPMGLRPALVMAVESQSATLLTSDRSDWVLPLAGVQWARRFLDQETIGDEIETVDQVLNVGDIVYTTEAEDGSAVLSQVPTVQGAMVAIDPQDGAIVSLVGGLDFNLSKFNRVLQARRQPGSVFKPFIYSAALELGLTPATIINDNAVVFQDAALEDVWRPKNYTGRFFGPTRLREALIKSRNLVSIRVLDRIGIVPTIEHLQKFGFERDSLPRDLSLALGSAALTPLELVDGYAVFANGGFNVTPYFIDRIHATDGEILFASQPAIACAICVEKPLIDEEVQVANQMYQSVEDPLQDPRCTRSAYYTEQEHLPRAVSAQNVHLMSSMMRDVIRRGTGVRANRLGRTDLAGKTGTTNDNRDAWFSGFNSSIAAVSWIGFDQEKPLGRGEAGASAALPQWTYFMQEALANTPSSVMPEPPGMVTVLIAPDTGLLASATNTNAIFETFRLGMVPQAEMEAEEIVHSPFEESVGEEEMVPVDEELF